MRQRIVDFSFPTPSPDFAVQGPPWAARLLKLAKKVFQLQMRLEVTSVHPSPTPTHLLTLNWAATQTITPTLSMNESSNSTCTMDTSMDDAHKCQHVDTEGFTHPSNTVKLAKAKLSAPSCNH